MDKNLVFPEIKLLGEKESWEKVTSTQEGNFELSFSSKTQVAEKPTNSLKETLAFLAKGSLHPISRIALGRSGDKGDSSNIGVLARTPKAYKFLKEILTAQVVKNLFAEICFGKVTRYTLDNLSGLNFLLEESLGGGGSVTLRSDAQGKTFAQALLRQKIYIPKEILEEIIL